MNQRSEPLQDFIEARIGRLKADLPAGDELARQLAEQVEKEIRVHTQSATPFVARVLAENEAAMRAWVTDMVDTARWYIQEGQHPRDDQEAAWLASGTIEAVNTESGIIRLWIDRMAQDGWFDFPLDGRFPAWCRAAFSGQSFRCLVSDKAYRERDWEHISLWYIFPRPYSWADDGLLLDLITEALSGHS